MQEHDILGNKKTVLPLNPKYEDIWEERHSSIL